MEPKKNKDKYNSCLMIQNFFHLTDFCTATTSFKYFKPFGRTSKIIPPPWYEGALMEPLARVLDVLQYFEKALLSVENLWSSRQNEV